MWFCLRNSIINWQNTWADRQRQNKRDPPKSSTIKKWNLTQIGSQLFRWLVEVFPPKNWHFVGFETMLFHENCLDTTTLETLKFGKSQKIIFEDLFTKAKFSKSVKSIQKTCFLVFSWFFWYKRGCQQWEID